MTTKPEIPRRVVCAAIKNTETGQIICGVRHYDELMGRQIEAQGLTPGWKSAEQGFVNAYGEWLTREQALIAAQANNQIIDDWMMGGGGLHSENIY